MKAIVLAAGYATRLRPLTDSIAKPLLPIADRPMIDWIVDKIDEVEEVDDVHVVTNSRHAPDFGRWAAERGGVRVHDDGTTSNDDRLGAIGDIDLTLREAGIGGDDLLVIAGDNLFDYSLADYIRFWSGKRGASAVAVFDVGDRELAKQYGIVDVDADDRVVGFVEKPAEPPSTLSATATYLYAQRHAALVGSYLDEGNPPDQPGLFLGWLYTREPVYAYRIAGGWWDVGDPAQLLEVDNRLRARAGLPLRTAYSLD